MGLLDNMDFNDPKNQGLLAAAAQMLQQSGPSRMPVGLGQIMGGGLSAFNGGMQAAQQRKLEEAQQQQMAQMRGLQIQGLQGELTDKDTARKQQLDAQKFMRDYNSMQTSPTAAAQRVLGSNMAPTIENSDRLAAAQPPMQGQQGQQGGTQAQFMQRMQKAQAMRNSGNPVLIAGADALEKSALAFQPKVKNWEKVNVGGRTLLKPYFEDGTAGEPVTADVAEKLQFQNLGGKTVALDPFSGRQVSEYGNSQSPDSIASNAVSMRGQNMTDSRARELNAITREGQQTQVINDPIRGPLLVNKGTGVVRNGRGMDGLPIQGETGAKKEAGAKSVLPILDQIDKLLPAATGSYGGAGVDQAARFFGGSTKGAENIAQLRVMESQLMMSQPRMEGPQSDKDVAMYRQAAGQIGDPTVPAAIKKAAMSSIREIMERNAGVAAGAAPAAPGKTATLADIAETARKSGRTTAEVTAKLKEMGYSIGGK